MFLWLAFLTVTAGVPYLWLERRGRARWQEIEVGRERVHAAESGAYREGHATVPVFRREAPLLVRVSAFTSFFFGQLFALGLLVGAVGLLFGGVGILLAPGLVANVKLYLAGAALLRREPRTAWFRARSAAAWTLWVNAALLCLLGLSAYLVSFVRPAIVWMSGYLLLSSLPAVLLLVTAARNEDALFLPTAIRPPRGEPSAAAPGETLLPGRVA